MWTGPLLAALIAAQPGAPAPTPSTPVVEAPVPPSAHREAQIWGVPTWGRPDKASMAADGSLRKRSRGLGRGGRIVLGVVLGVGAWVATAGITAGLTALNEDNLGVQ